MTDIEKEQYFEHLKQNPKKRGDLINVQDCLKWIESILTAIQDPKKVAMFELIADALFEVHSEKTRLSLISELARFNHQYINRKRPIDGVYMNSIVIHLSEGVTV